MLITFGVLLERQRNHGNTIKEHTSLLLDHGQHLQRIDIALVRIEEYNRGLEMGMRLLGAGKPHRVEDPNV